jgi:hypothetical protein
MKDPVLAPPGVRDRETVAEGDVCDYWPVRDGQEGPVTARVTRAVSDTSGTQIVIQTEN